MCCFVPAVAVSFFLCVCVYLLYLHFGGSTWCQRIQRLKPPIWHPIPGWIWALSLQMPMSSHARSKDALVSKNQIWFQVPQFIRKKTLTSKSWLENINLFVFRFNKLFRGKWPLPQTKCWKHKKGHWCREMLWKHSNDSERIEEKHQQTASWCQPTWISSKRPYISKRFITSRLQDPKTKNCEIWTWKKVGT